MKNIDSVKEYFGLDIGNSSIKLVQLKSSHPKPELVTIGSTQTPDGLIASDTPESKREIAKLIVKLAKDSQVTSNNVIASLPNSIVSANIIRAPKLKKQELDQSIKFQAEKYIPIPIDQAKIDWADLGETPDGKEVEVLLVAAPLEKANKYLEILQLAGLELLALEINPLAHIRCFSSVKNSRYCIVDLGMSETGITIVDNHIPKLIRSVNIGIRNLVANLAENLNLPPDQANGYLWRLGIGQSQMQSQIFSSIQQQTDTVIQEISRSINFYNNQVGADTVKKLIFTGGGISVPGLVSYYSGNLKIPAEYGNPWQHVSYSPSRKQYIDKTVPTFATAVGLAMRNLIE
ncbi:type IV pilus assembly protein PilM [Candidatus Saccharibacteria bacterium]|nr:type IV pilus assembly protein PilM [Candidatus Saccharibacteria bacterium]